LSEVQHIDGTGGSRPTILFVIGSMDIGGAERHLAQLLPRLVQRGFGVHLFTLTGRGELAEEVERAGVSVHSPDGVGARVPSSFLGRALRLLASASRFRSVIRKADPLIVHAFLAEGYLFARTLTLFDRRMVFIMSRRSLNNYQSKRPVLAWYERWLHGSLDLASGNSRAILEQLVSERIPRSKLRLIYNGVAISRSSSMLHDGRRDRAASDDRVIIVCVANILPYKRHDLLIRALKRMSVAIPPDRWRCLLVGRIGVHGELVRGLVRGLGLDGSIDFLGSVRDVMPILHTADIGILISAEEGFSNSVLEKMAASLPVVVTDVGGNAEAVVDGVTGVVVAPDDEAGIAEALARLILDRGLRERLGEAAHARVSETFSIESTCEGYIDLYRSALERLRARGARGRDC
jgi:glycosyltransferase involved in cell wall biosynthesis